MLDEKNMLLCLLLLSIIILAGVSYLAVTKSSYPETITITQQPEKKTLDVSGTAQKYVTPDLLVIKLGTESEGKDAASTESDNAKKIAAVKKSLLDSGIPEEKIKTSYYSLDPKRNWSNKGEIIGYTVVHMLTVEVENLSMGGQLLDKAVGAGANRVDYLSFTLKDKSREEVERELFSLASNDAKSRADAIAKGLGLTVGKPISISEHIRYPPYYVGYKTAALPEAVETVISPGQIEVTATVSVSFEIE